MYNGVFIAEGTSDAPLAAIVVELFQRCQCKVEMSVPELSRLESKVPLDIESKLRAVHTLLEGATPDFLVVHRDADDVVIDPRGKEIQGACALVMPDVPVVCVVPAYMTETWILLDELMIRQVAGNRRGRDSLTLPSRAEVERRAYPKDILAQAFLDASGATGRRRLQQSKRFSANRRRLLETLDPDGPVANLASWKAIEGAVVAVARRLGEVGT